MAFLQKISKIECSDIAEDGGEGSTYAELGKTLRDTLAFNPTAATKQQVFSEENDDPELNVTTAAAILAIAWTVMEIDATVMQKLFGGSVVNGQWQAPAQVPTIEQSIKITPRVGQPFIFPRCEITADPNYDTSNKIFSLNVTATRLKPTKDGEPSWKFGELESSQS
jgi:hypothetical protein